MEFASIWEGNVGPICQWVDFEKVGVEEND